MNFLNISIKVFLVIFLSQILQAETYSVKVKKTKSCIIYDNIFFLNTGYSSSFTNLFMDNKKYKQGKGNINSKKGKILAPQGVYKSKNCIKVVNNMLKKNLSQNLIKKNKGFITLTSDRYGNNCKFVPYFQNINDNVTAENILSFWKKNIKGNGSFFSKNTFKDIYLYEIDVVSTSGNYNKMIFVNNIEYPIKSIEKILFDNKNKINENELAERIKLSFSKIWNINQEHNYIIEKDIDEFLLIYEKKNLQIKKTKISKSEYIIIPTSNVIENKYFKIYN